MRSIVLLNQLTLKDSNLYVGDSPIHLRQGDIDGACGPYSLLMALLIKKVINREDVTELGSYDARTRLGIFLEKLKSFGPLFREGSNHHEMEWLAKCFKNHQKGKVSTTAYTSLNLRENLKQISEELNDGNAVIIGLEWAGGGAHWAVAVGYEVVDDFITKIFTLDPGYQYTPNSYWNAMISAVDDNDYVSNKGKFSCNYLVVGSEINHLCKVTELISLKVS